MRPCLARNTLLYHLLHKYTAFLKRCYSEIHLNICIPNILNWPERGGKKTTKKRFEKYWQKWWLVQIKPINNVTAVVGKSSFCIKHWPLELSISLERFFSEGFRNTFFLFFFYSFVCLFFFFYKEGSEYSWLSSDSGLTQYFEKSPTSVQIYGLRLSHTAPQCYICTYNRNCFFFPTCTTKPRYLLLSIKLILLCIFSPSYVVQ